MENKQCCKYYDDYRREIIVISEKFAQDLQDSIKEIINKEGYVSYDIDASKVITGGNNYLGELYEINISGETSEGRGNRTSLFLKHIILNETFKVYSIPEVYAKESFVYKELLKLYEDFQKKAAIPLEDRLNIVKCYEETNDRVIILENLTIKGYKPWPRFEVMSIDFAELSIKQLARFHGLSMVLQNRNPEYFDSRIKTIKQSFVYDGYWNELAKKMCDFSSSRMDENTKKRIGKLFLISLKKYPIYMNGLNSNIKCLVHGDYKMNNVLFKESNGLTTEVIPLDYQQIYFGCPVIDLLYFIYAASDLDFRKQHLHHLRDVYFDSLTSFLQHFDTEPAFTRQDYEKCFEDSLDYALMYTLYMLPMFFVEDNVPDLAKDELLETNFNVNERFYTTMQGIVDEFIEMGVL